jgi:NAD-dependent dihydropyrimidine dehydrogenase PreA subunit
MAAQVLYCNCSYARIIPPETKSAVLEGLTRAKIEFDAVPDLCEMAARRDPRLQELAKNGPLRIAACYPRAVKWLLASAGVQVDDGTKIFNMRTEPAETVLEGILASDGNDGPSPGASRHPLPKGEGLEPKPGAWKPWFPVIDYQRCTNCMQCLSFCLFDVYGVSPEGKIRVQNQENCKTDCPACSRVCPEVAIMFPKYRHGPINGDEVNADDVRREAMKVDISALLGGDIYAMLRDRSAKAKSRFSKERDDERALKERQTCLLKLQQTLDIPAEVLAALPTEDQIRAKAEAALARARQAGSDPPLSES